MTDPEIVLPIFLSAIAAYLIGSVSFSIIFTRIFMKRDVRDFGSGNAGATNVLRTAGKLPAALTFAGDFLKCVAAIELAVFFFNAFGGTFDSMSIRFLAGIFCMLGHIFPIYFGFRGGKGVAVTAALLLMADWRLFLVVFAVFAVVFAFSRIVSLATIVGVVSLPFSTFFVSAAIGQRNPALNTFFAVLIMCIVLVKHRSNIRRLKNGTEPHIGEKAKPKGGD